MSMINILATGLIPAPETLDPLKEEQTAALEQIVDPLPQVTAITNHVSMSKQGDRHKGIGLVEYSGTAEPGNASHIEAALTAVATGNWHIYMLEKRIQRNTRAALERAHLERIRTDKALKEKQKAEGNVTFPELQAFINAVLLSRTEK